MLERWFVQFKSWTGVGKCSEGRSNIVTVDFTESILVPDLKNECKRVETSRDNTDTGINWNFLPHMPPHVTNVPAVYKKTILMLWSLYSLTRFPATDRLFCMSCSSPKRYLFTLSYKLSTATSLLCLTNYPLLLQQFLMRLKWPPLVLHPLIPYGDICLSKAFTTTISVTASEVNISGSHIITDYVGSPTMETSWTLCGH